MSALEQLAAWISENESLFSGLAALVALAALVPAALGPMLRRRKAKDAKPANARQSGSDEAAPRLAVFPLETTGSGDETIVAAEIVTDEVTAFLARSGGCEVISRRSAAAFAVKGGTPAEAAAELDVRYVVEGQLRKAGGGLRVSTSLVDTAQNRVAWSGTFEVENEELDELALGLAEQLASHLGVEVTRAEVGRSRRRPSSGAARDLLLRAHGVLFEEGHSRASYGRALDLLDQAVKADPESAEAHSMIGLLIGLGNVFGFVEMSEERQRQAMAGCARAIELDDQSSEVLGYVGCAYCDMQQRELGFPLLDRAVELNPSNAQAKAALGTAYIGERRYEEGAAALEDALRISPAYKGVAPWATVLTSAYLRLGNLERAEHSLDLALRCDPTFFPAHLSAAVLGLMQQDLERAERHTREAQRNNPELDLATLTSLVGRRNAETLKAWLE